MLITGGTLPPREVHLCPAEAAAREADLEGALMALFSRAVRSPKRFAAADA
jgi:hypothetical protein